MISRRFATEWYLRGISNQFPRFLLPMTSHVDRPLSLKKKMPNFSGQLSMNVTYNPISSQIRQSGHFRSIQRRRRRSGWSGQGRTTFQRVVCLVLRLQRQSEDDTQAHLVFAFLVIVPTLIPADQEPGAA